MAGFTIYQANTSLDGLLGSGTPATIYVALFTTTPSDSDPGVEVSSVDTGYSRVAVTNNTTNWPAASARSKKNGTVILFPVPTQSWGTVNGFALFDAATGGNRLVEGNLSTPITVSTQQSFAVDALTISINPT